MTPEEAVKYLEITKRCAENDTAGELTRQMCDVSIEAIKEVQQYREIGTVEECREAVEKQKPKKPKDSLKINPVIDGNGAYVDADMTVYLLCPNCG